MPRKKMLETVTVIDDDEQYLISDFVKEEEPTDTSNDIDNLKKKNQLLIYSEDGSLEKLCIYINNKQVKFTDFVLESDSLEQKIYLNITKNFKFDLSKLQKKD